MRHFPNAIGMALLSLILAYSAAATVAADGGWGAQNNGYGQYHVSMAESLHREQPLRQYCDKLLKSSPSQHVA
jgi:hypothetical protein